MPKERKKVVRRPVEKKPEMTPEQKIELMLEEAQSEAECIRDYADDLEQSLQQEDWSGTIGQLECIISQAEAALDEFKEAKKAQDILNLERRIITLKKQQAEVKGDLKQAEAKLKRLQTPKKKSRRRR